MVALIQLSETSQTDGVAFEECMQKWNEQLLEKICEEKSISSDDDDDTMTSLGKMFDGSDECEMSVWFDNITLRGSRMLTSYSPVMKPVDGTNYQTEQFPSSKIASFASPSCTMCSISLQKEEPVVNHVADRLQALTESRSAQPSTVLRVLPKRKMKKNPYECFNSSEYYQAEVFQLGENLQLGENMNLSQGGTMDFGMYGNICHRHSRNTFNDVDNIINTTAIDHYKFN